MRIIKKIYVFLLMFLIIIITGCYNNKKTNEIIEVNGINYELNSDNNAYLVTGYTSSIKENVKLENEINNLPVIKVEDEAFENCLSILKITITKNILEIGDSAFSNCWLLEEVIFEEYSALEIIGENAFEKCLMLESIILPNKVKEIKNNSFYDCERLYSVSIPDSIEVIGNQVFYNCNLSYNIYEEVYYLGNSQNPYVFLTSCNKFEYFDFIVPEGTRIIGSSAFKNQYIQKVTLSRSLYNIKQYAFAYCPVLEEIFIPGNVKLIGENAFNPTYKLKYIYLETNEIPSTFNHLWNNECNAQIILNYKPTN